MKSSLVGLFMSLVVLPFSSFAQIARSTGVKDYRAFVYHGKIVRPDGTTPTGSLSVKLEIHSPDPGLCLLWSETQTVELKNGAFAVEIGHAVNRTTGAAGGAAANFNQAFVNNPGLTISGAQCGQGSSYTPGVSACPLHYKPKRSPGLASEA